MIKVSAPGKICIAGEWAVLEVGNPLIVAAINKRVFAKIKESRDEFFYISIKDFGIKDLKASFIKNELKFDRKLKKREKIGTIFIKPAIELALRYFGKIKPFEIETAGEEVVIRAKGRVKAIGFGSSSASVVATIGGLFKFYGEDIEKKESKEKIYKLSSIAHYLAQGKVGSGFDIAASTFGGVLIYKRFDPQWLKNQFNKKKDLKEIIEENWPAFYIEPLEIPNDFNLLLGWTGESSSTSKMVKELNQWKEKNKSVYRKTITLIKDLVEELIKAWKSNDKARILKLIRKNEDYLRDLGEQSGLNIETETLLRLSKIANENGGAGKLSGAGGGDCGIAITFNNKENSDRIKKEWNKNGIHFIDTALSLKGIREEI